MASLAYARSHSVARRYLRAVESLCAYRLCRAGIYALKKRPGAAEAEKTRFIVFAETRPFSKTLKIWDALLKPFFVLNIRLARGPILHF